jgi:hypothetical protein
MSNLKDDIGRDFATDDDMKAYVREFYADLYKIPDVDTNFNEDCIHNFLDGEICNFRLVRDSKIPHNLMQDFEPPLSIS